MQKTIIKDYWQIRDPHKGVSLIELMVTVTIAGIMLTIAAPSLQTFIRSSHIRTVTNGLTGMLNLSRSEAVKRGWPMTLCKTNDVNAATLACNNSATWQDGWIVFSDFDQDGVIDAGESPLRVGKPDTEKITINGDTNFSNYVTYLPTGVSLGNGGSADGTLDLCLEGLQRIIDISSTGRITIESGSC